MIPQLLTVDFQRVDEPESELEARARQGGWLDPPPGQHVDVRTKVTQLSHLVSSHHGVSCL